MGTINLWAILVASIVAHFIGALWYSPLLFGNIWLSAVKISKKEFAKAQKKGMAKMILSMLAASLVMSYVLANVMQFGLATDWASGMGIGFWMWLGFVATTSLGAVMYANKSWTAYLIDTGYYLVGLMAMGAILAVWV